VTVPGGIASGAGPETAGGGGATGADSGLGVAPFGAAARGAPLVGIAGGGGAGAAGVPAICYLQNNYHAGRARAILIKIWILP